ncbi:class I SAM-dependent methyltransferase [Planotetraspora sp. A-T 1434]|uniref:class I SAM-dependent methyltransferase n=1 Tax=Planotetraspora sp. A-T 1434 TaxID=2979219 RepID=UPI0021C05899|nr:class I SAM-dependent methyltransferase [Planotetraspora sp. A-T 1434]MCT9933520.1 class I SAM-dependent methyltransferase [Planotetraspora sp. A-T 1434]
MTWAWDETLYLGSAPYYARGRLPYAPGLAEALRESLGLDGSGRLLDVGCGPGVVALTLVPLFEEVVGVDPDPGMIEEARRRGVEAGVSNAEWVQLRAEDLPAGLGSFRVIVFAQSFHWMDREKVAATSREMLPDGGSLVHISDLKELPPLPTGAAPRPPFDEIKSLVRSYLGATRRAGQGLLPDGTPSGEARVLRAAGFAGPRHLVVPGGQVVERSADDVVAWTYSRSDSAPHLFGERLPQFEADLRWLLHRTSAVGRFTEVVPDTEVFIWDKKTTAPG